MASHDSRGRHCTQQSSWTVLYSDGSEAKDCQELPSIRLVDPDNGVVSLRKVTRETFD